jgi:hypothetical protein
VATEKTASFGIKVDADSNAKEASADLETLKRSISENQEAVKQYGSAMRSLRGDSDEVKDAKKKLKGEIDALRDAISRETLAIGKQGTTYDALVAKEKRAREEAKRLAEEQKRLAEQAKGVRNAIAAAGGPVQELSGKLDTLRGILGETGGGLALTTLAGAGLVATLAAVTAATVAGAVAFGRWVLEGANVARTMGLVREAATGSAASSTAFGHQIDELARKVSVPRAELQDLSVELSRATIGTRISGQGIVDTFNAVAQASDAMGKTAGAKIQDIITRGKQFGMMSLGRFELQGTGLQFEDVAKQLSKNLKIGIDEARQQLVLGRVQIDAGAKAVRDAVEARFAGINLRKMLDLNVLAQKFQERLANLTSGVNLEPLLAAISRISSLFDETTVTGAALKTIVTTIGNEFVGGLAGGADMAKYAIQSIVITSQDLLILYLRNRNTIRDFFKNSLPDAQSSIDTIKGSLAILTVAMAALVVPSAAVAASFVAFAKSLGEVITAVQKLATGPAEERGQRIGQALGGGVKAGLMLAMPSVAASAISMVDSIKASFTGPKGIDAHSPSKLFEREARKVPEGVASGIERGASDVQQAAQAMAPQPARGAAPGIARGGASEGAVTIQVTAVFPNAKSGADVADALAGPSFLAQLRHEIKRANLSRGIPTQTPGPT